MAIKPAFLLRQIDVQIRLRALNFFSVGLLFIQPAIFSGVSFVLSRISGSATPDLIYTVIGGGVTGLWSSLLFTSFYDIVRDRREGTLEIIVGSPTSLSAVLGMRTLANVLFGSISMLASFLVAAGIFHYSLAGIAVLPALCSLGILILSFWVCGVFLANFHALSRVSGTAVNYIEIPVAVFCAFMFPVRILPGWMQVISEFIPIRWAVEAFYQALTGPAELTVLLRLWAITLLVCGAYLLINRVFQKFIHDQIRITGELSSI